MNTCFKGSDLEGAKLQGFDSLSRALPNNPAVAAPEGPRHKHDMKRVAIKGMGFATYRCDCGYETDARYDDKAEIERLERELEAAREFAAAPSAVPAPDYCAIRNGEGRCQYPDCGCAEARLCIGKDGPNYAARALNLPHRKTP